MLPRQERGEGRFPSGHQRCSRYFGSSLLVCGRARKNRESYHPKELVLTQMPQAETFGHDGLERLSGIRDCSDSVYDQIDFQLAVP